MTPLPPPSRPDVPQEVKQSIDFWVGGWPSYIKCATITMHAVPRGGGWEVTLTLEPPLVEPRLFHFGTIDGGHTERGVDLMTQLYELTRWILQARHELRKAGPHDDSDFTRSPMGVIPLPPLEEEEE